MTSTPTPPKQRPMSPATWAEIASEGRWRPGLPHLDYLNRKLVGIASQRIRGIKTRTIVSMPPRMGKSQLISEYFTGWWLGTFPEDRVMVTAYQDDFAMEWGQKSRDAFRNFAPSIFGLELDPEKTASSRWGVKGHRGEMQTAGAGGGLMGKGPELMIIDDPIKDQQQAESETHRNHLWNWYATSIRTRMEPGGAIIIPMQRWHADDLVGRLLAKMQDGTGMPWDLIELKAIAEDGDPLGRRPGEALWPEKMAIEELEAMRKEDPYWFTAQYQQDPTPLGGSFFRPEWFPLVDEVPANSEFCRYWDKAASEGKGDYTVGVLMARSPEGMYYVADVKRDRMASAERDRFILQTAREDSFRYKGIAIRGEEEGGSSGKDASLAFVRLLDGFDVDVDRVTGDKASRARPFAAQAKGGNVRMLRSAVWNKPYLAELSAFRDDGKNKHDDQVDASSGAYNELFKGVGSWSLGRSPTSGYSGPRLALAKRA